VLQEFQILTAVRPGEAGGARSDVGGGENPRFFGGELTKDCASDLPAAGTRETFPCMSCGEFR